MHNETEYFQQFIHFLETKGLLKIQTNVQEMFFKFNIP